MTAVIVASIGAVGAVLVALVERGRRQNSREHGETLSHITWVLRTLDRVEHKLERHIRDHNGQGK